MQIARVKLSGTNYGDLEEVSRHIKQIASKFGASVAGPIPLPTKKLKISTRKAPSGDGTETYEKWELHVHKRVVDIGMNERALRQIMRVDVPDSVNIEIELKED